MSIIRNRHNADKYFVMLDKSVLWSEKLSLKAVGLWARCISRPDNWIFHIKELISKCKEGRDSVYKAIGELIEFRLCIRVQYQLTIRKDGKVYPGAGPIEYIFLEVPETKENCKKIEKELRDAFEKKLRDDGLEFYKPSPKKPSMNSKNKYMLPENTDTLITDAENQHLTRTINTKYIKETKQNDDVVFSEKIQREGDLPKGLYTKLKKEFGDERLNMAIEYMKTVPNYIDNAYGWLMKCLKERWYESDKINKSAKHEENKRIASIIAEKVRGHLRDNCNLEAGKNELFIFKGHSAITIEYKLANFKERINIELNKMGLTDIVYGPNNPLK